MPALVARAVAAPQPPRRGLDRRPEAAVAADGRQRDPLLGGQEGQRHPPADEAGLRRAAQEDAAPGERLDVEEAQVGALAAQRELAGGQVLERIDLAAVGRVVDPSGAAQAARVLGVREAVAVVVAAIGARGAARGAL
jgi:hypothetical protein